MDIQVKKGLLDYCVLRVLQTCDSYGYQMIRDLAPVVELSESTLYPILRRLEMAKEVASYSVEHSGRLRRYYRITEAGQKRLRDFRLQIGQIQTALSYIQGNGSPEKYPTGREEP